jgi:squalene-hopene/tetraprenyl-beta-curcumene cyclase
MRAWQLWRPHLGEDTVLAMNRATQRALTYLYRTQNQDGSWDPLWFGNQHLKDENNPLYGTAKVVEGCLSVVANPLADPAMLRAIDWLLAQQNDDGGWGATRGLPNTIEESSLALSSLAQSMKAMSRGIPRELEERLKASLQRGADWLCERIENQAYRKHAPIGFYFAKLWYHECLYPMVYTAAAMRALHAVQPTFETS